MNVKISEAVECNTWKTCTKCNEERKTVFFSKYINGTKAQCKYCDAKAYRDKKNKHIEQPVVYTNWYDKLIDWLF